MNIGILALQGAFEEHKKVFESLGVSSKEIRQKKDLSGIDAIVLPGGESTVQGELLRKLDIFIELKNLIEAGLPTLATCAGAILLAKKIENDPDSHLASLPVKLKEMHMADSLAVFRSLPTLER
jgi:5'-phosphate synthase pdxT subunit